MCLWLEKNLVVSESFRMIYFISLLKIQSAKVSGFSFLMVERKLKTWWCSKIHPTILLPCYLVTLLPCYLLPVACYLLPVTCYLLPVTCYLLPVILLPCSLY